MSFGELFKIDVYHGYILQILLAELLFIPVFKFRKGIVWRAIVGFAVYAVVSVIFTNLMLKVVPGFSSFIIFLLSLGFAAVCVENKFSEVLFCCIGAQLLQNLAHNVEQLIYLPFQSGISTVGWFFISVGVMAAVYAAGYVLIVRKLIAREKISLNTGGILVIAAVSALFCYLMQFLMTSFDLSTLWVTFPPLILCDVLALLVQFGLVIYKNRAEENIRLESVLAGESKVYDAYKQSINIINMKAHDLKHFIAGLGADIDAEGLEEIRSAVERYEETANTGNKALDVVLTEKTYLCHKYGIAITAMVNGEQLAFMHKSDIVSLFGNALDNAIEHEKTVDEDKRCITVKVHRRAGLVGIHIENYCETVHAGDGGLPQTSKTDKDNHGFGLKSMRFIVQKYGGNLTVSTRDNMFIVDIVIPIK